MIVLVLLTLNSVTLPVFWLRLQLHLRASCSVVFAVGDNIKQILATRFSIQFSLCLCIKYFLIASRLFL